LSRKKQPAGAVRRSGNAAVSDAAESASSTGGLPGCVDIISHEEIVGWAWNPLDPDECVIVEIFDGRDLLVRVRADVYREDVHTAGIGSGRYGFVVRNPAGLLPLACHRISVRRAADGVDLNGSPQWLLRSGAGCDSSLTQFLDAAASATTSVARAPQDLDQQLTLTLRVLNQLLNARASLNEDRPPLSDPRLQDLLRGAEVSDWTRELLLRIQSEFTPLHFERADEPLVTIVIPAYNKFRTTYNCLRSIAENPPKASFEIVVVDDGSRDETLFGSLLVSGGAKFIRNTKNEGFIRSCNAGAATARGAYLFFLNNDTLVRPNWLDELVSTFDTVPNLGIVGSKLLFEDGSLQEAGGIIWRLGDAWNWGRGADAKEPRFCFLRDCDYVSGAALMIKRELFEHLDGFDEHFVPAYYEDADLCLRVRAAGKRVVMQPGSEIVHLEGVTAGRDIQGSGMKRYQLLNQRKFYARWREKLATHRFLGEQPELEAERTVKRRAVFIDCTVLTPDQDAGSAAALNHILELMALGYKVTFVAADNMAQINPYTLNLQKLGIECLYHPYYGSVEDTFRRMSVKPELVYLHRFVNAAKYASLARQYFPTCFTVYNVADLHSLRQERELAVAGALSVGPRVTEEAEIAAMRQVDAVIVHSSVEAALLRQKAPELRVHVVPWTVLPRPADTPFKDRSGYAFIGSYGHAPNLDAAKYLSQEIAPLINGRGRDIVGFLVGSNPPPQLASLEAENIRVLGYVPDLTGLLHRLRCTAAPLRYGAGLKGKVLESLAHGIPCVMSDVAAEGIELPQRMEWLVARTAREFASKLANIHEDQALNEELAAYGLEFIQKNFNGESTRRLLAEATSRK
jgi:O-antigen biosynthesis protein